MKALDTFADTKGKTTYFNNPESEQAHAELRVHKHYNGSGDNAFGGAKEWPALTLSIGLDVDATAEELRLLEDEILTILCKRNYQVTRTRIHD